MGHEDSVAWGGMHADLKQPGLELFVKHDVKPENLEASIDINTRNVRLARTATRLIRVHTAASRQNAHLQKPSPALMLSDMTMRLLAAIIGATAAQPCATHLHTSLYAHDIRHMQSRTF